MHFPPPFYGGGAEQSEAEGDLAARPLHRFAVPRVRGRKDAILYEKE
jgi:hypothetical protein